MTGSHDARATLRDLLREQLALARSAPQMIARMDAPALTAWATRREELTQAASQLMSRVLAPGADTTPLTPNLPELRELRALAAEVAAADDLNRFLVRRSLACVRGVINTFVPPAAASYDRRGAAAASALAGRVSRTA